MSVRIVANVLDYVHDIPHGAKLVLICMADYADDQGRCWPSFQKLSDRCDMSRRHVIRVVSDLEELGFVRKIEERPYKPTVYGLTIPTSDTHVTSKQAKVVTPTSLVTPTTLVTPMSLGSDTHVTTTSDTHVTLTINKPSKNPQYPDEFEKFWTQYPSGNGSKKATYAQWKRLGPNPLLVDDIMQGLDRWKRSERWQRGYVKSAEIWVRDRYWENPPADTTRAAVHSGLVV